MPMHPGIPITQDQAMPGSYGQEQAPVNWVDWAGSTFLGISPQAAMRGQPPPLSWWHQRTGPRTPTPMLGTPIWLQSRPYDRGAGAYSPKFGTIPVNPIGAGIYAPYKLPVIAGPAARYEFGAIWFDVQSIPTTMRMNPTVPVETVNALLASSHVGPSYRTTG